MMGEGGFAIRPPPPSGSSTEWNNMHAWMQGKILPYTAWLPSLPYKPLISWWNSIMFHGCMAPLSPFDCVHPQMPQQQIHSSLGNKVYSNQIGQLILTTKWPGLRLLPCRVWGCTNAKEVLRFMTLYKRPRMHRSLSYGLHLLLPYYCITQEKWRDSLSCPYVELQSFSAWCLIYLNE